MGAAWLDHVSFANYFTANRSFTFLGSCPFLDQGLRWYAKRLRIDQDGDVADTFLEEVSSGRSAVAAGHHKKAARFKLKDGTRPVKVKQQVLSDGKVQHRVEHQGRLQLV